MNTFIIISLKLIRKQLNYIQPKFTSPSQIHFSTILLCVFLFLASSITLHAQSAGDYRSNAATMNWSAAGSWQTYNGTTWVTASTYPGQSSGTGAVTIQAGHNVTLDVSVSNALSSLTINGTGAVLTVSSNQSINVSGVNITNGGSINWTANVSLTLNANCVISISSSPSALTTSNCNANKKLLLGTVLYAACSSQQGEYKFADLNASTGTIAVVASSNSPVCQSSGTLNLTATPSGTYTTITYSWSGTGTGGYTYSSSTQNPTISGLASGSYSFTVTVSDGLISNSSTVAVTVTPTVGTPTAISPAASTICQGSSNTTYTTSATNATSYVWSITGSGNSISGTSTTGTATWSSSYTGTATVSVYANGCNGPSSTVNTTVTVRATPTASVSATPTSVASGFSSTVNFTGTASSTVTYKINGGSDLTTNLSSGGTSSVNTGALTSDATYSLVSINDGTCSANLTGSTTINVTTLPVDMVEFKASTLNTEGGNKVNLEWITQNEVAVNYFEVERSSNGKDFKVISDKIVALNKISENYYQTTDNNALTGISYYRIKQLDKSNMPAYSKIQTIYIKNKKHSFDVFPNPVTSSQRINISTDFADKYEVRIFDVAGKLVYTSFKTGSTSLEDVKLNHGLYIYTIKAGDKSFSGKILFQ